jgi:trimethylamine---corrinoid protein Co-methyltransferase
MLRTRPEFLSDDEVHLIHASTLRVMREVGVVLPLPEAQAILQQHGATVEGQRVHFTDAMVETALASAPREFTLHARDPKRSRMIGGASPVFAPGYGAPFIMDADGATRPGTLADYNNLTRLADALPQLDACGYMLVEPADVSPATAYLPMMRATLTLSSKPCMGATEGVRGAQAAMDMAGIVFGSDTVKAKPVVLGLISTLSPLAFSREMLEALLTYARWRQPVIVTPLVQAGASGPVTLAGAAVQQNAEILAGLTLAQLVAPGTPVVYGGTSTAIDMRTGGLAIGAPEHAIFITLTAQLARHYGVPCRTSGAVTDAHALDAQAGAEAMLNILTAAQSGVHFVLHAAGILSGYLTISYEKLVLDDELCGVARRFLRGLTLTETDLALDVIARAGPNGAYLTDVHTLEHCRSEFFLPKLINRRGVVDWQAQGHPNIGQSARAAWRRLLEQHEPPLPDPIIVRQLDHYVEAHA